MDNKIIRAYLLQEVIRLGFSPSSTKDKKKWLLQYGNSLKLFWDTENYPPAPSMNGNVLSATINSSEAVKTLYEYAIESADKFAVRLIHSPNTNLMWTHDMDGGYFCFPNQLFLSMQELRTAAIEKMTEDDLKSIVDTLLIHPTPHQHIESPIDNHDIRIGGGITNPFLYLFHLRIQLCPIPDRRDAERGRLIDLFDYAIRNNTAFTIPDLMAAPEN